MVVHLCKREKKKKKGSGSPACLFSVEEQMSSNELLSRQKRDGNKSFTLFTFLSSRRHSLESDIACLT